VNYSLNHQIYYGGFDPGSGQASLKLHSDGGAEPLQEVFTLSSFVADGDAGKLLDKGGIDATLTDVLAKGEYVLSFQGNTYFLGSLITEGRNQTDAKGDSERYWSQHSQLLLLALTAHMIPDRSCELRIVTALPVALYNKDNRRRMKEALEGYYRYEFQGKPRELTVKVGYVAMEGQGVLISRGESKGKQGIIDIGERTTDLVAADGQRLITSLCAGDEIGIGQVVDAIQSYLQKRYGRILTTQEAHEQLKAYAHGKSLPSIRVQGRPVDPAEIERVITGAIDSLGRTLKNLINATWNEEGGRVASSFDNLLLAGGGAYYLEEIIHETLQGIQRLEVSPELANAEGYADLAVSLEDQKADIWEI
jgi:hypothetical protein